MPLRTKAKDLLPGELTANGEYAREVCLQVQCGLLDGNEAWRALEVCDSALLREWHYLSMSPEEPSSIWEGSEDHKRLLKLDAMFGLSAMLDERWES
jgi:hypothetical protein